MRVTPLTAWASRVPADFLVMHAVTNTPVEPAGSVALFIPTSSGLPRMTGGSAPTLPFSRPAQRSLALRPACSLSRLTRPFVLGVFQQKSLPPLTAPTASGWSDPLPGGTLTHWKSPSLHGTLSHQGERIATPRVVECGVTHRIPLCAFRIPNFLVSRRHQCDGTQQEPDCHQTGGNDLRVQPRHTSPLCFTAPPECSPCTGTLQAVRHAVA